MRTKLWYGLLLVFVFLIGGLVSYYLIRHDFVITTSNNSGNGVCYTNCTNKVVIEEAGISDSVDKIYDSVVMIQNYKNGQVITSGTGFVYKVDNEKGYLLTNQHVVEGSDRINIILSNDKEVDATYIGGDSYLDLAVISILKDDVLKVAELGNSEMARIGDTVFTIGSPLGYEYRGTMTRGTLSGKDRVITVSTNNYNSSGDYMMRVLQTDAAINPGNSGGPLVNSNGEVIGINSLKLVQDSIEGMGFAIPIEYAISHLEAFEKGEIIERPVLGVSLINVTDTSSLFQNRILIDNTIENGAVVAGVSENSGAEKAGIKVGDVIIKIGENKISNVAYLKYELYKYSALDTIDVTFIRGTSEKTVKVVLGKSTS